MLKNFFNILKRKDKYDCELEFWKQEIEKYILWYTGKIQEHYGVPSPKSGEKVDVGILAHNAILTWTELHQKKKYLSDLALPANAFSGMKVLDIGAGPIPSATVFHETEVYCLDPLIPEYMRAGFPFHYTNAKLICARSEKIPCVDSYFDAVISANALDHVDDFLQTAKEIKRVLKPNGMVRLHLHYHEATRTEPIELNDGIVKSSFIFCNLAKIAESETKMGHVLQDSSEKYVLWSNF